MGNDVSIDVGIETRKARQGIDRLEKAFSDFADQASKDTKKATGALDIFSGTLGAISVASWFSSIKNGMIDIGQASLIAASDAEETSSKFNTVFSGISDQANKTADEIAKSYGLARSESRKLLGDTGDLLSGFGFTQQSALDLSSEVQKLAVDLASFTNFSGGASGASEALTKALLGERESVKSLGISIQEEDVKRKIALLRLQGMTFATERQAKAYATLKIAQEQSKNAIGDFARTSDGLANQQRILEANLQSASETFGKGLIPAFLTATKAGNRLLISNEDLIESFGALIGTKLNEFIDLAIQSIVPLANAVVFLNDVFDGLLTTYDFIKMGLNDLVGLFISSTESILNAAKAAQEFLGLDTSGIDDVISSVNALKEANDEVTQEISDGINKRLEKNAAFRQTVINTAETVQITAQNEIAAERAKTAAVTQETEKRAQIKQEAAIKEISEQDKINAKIAEIEKSKSEKIIETKANEIVALNELKAEQKAQEEEERNVALELEQNRADERLQRLTEVLGKEEAIRSEAEARRLDKEGKVAQAKKKRMAVDSKAEKENIFAIQRFEDLSQKQRVQNLQSTLGQISSLTQSSNKSLVAIGKAAAISQATIDGFSAVQKALASAPPPFNFALAATVGVATAANIAKIAGVKGFQDGGVVGGVPTDRDNQFARVASGEVILNRRQQAETLFQIANGGGVGGAGGGVTVNIEAGVGGISTEQIDTLIDAINDRTEFGNQSLRTA